MKARHDSHARHPLSLQRRPLGRGKSGLPPSPGEEGFILVGTLVTLLLLIVIGISATTTSTIEVQISGNEKVRTMSFFGADGGADVGARVLEENAACSTGFTSGLVGNVRVTDLDFAKNTTAAKPTSIATSAAYYPDGATDTTAHTRITAGGTTVATAGAGLAQVAGYEARGMGAAAGGGHVEYNIFAQRVEQTNSQSTVNIEWWHVIGLEGDCRY